MLSMRFAGPDDRAPHPPDAGSPDLHTWLDRRGGVVAEGFRHSGAYWMAWRSLATFRFCTDDPRITAYAVPGVPVDIIRDTYRRSVLPLALQALGWEALHASAIVCREGIVAFPAVSETGKSTVAFGLRRRGFPQWSDDGVVFKMEGDGAVALPLAFSVRLRPGSSKLFTKNSRPAVRLADREPGGQAHRVPQPVVKVCLLTRMEDGAAPGRPQLTAIPKARAFRELLAHAHVLDPSDEARRALMMRAYLELAARVQVWQVTFAPKRDQFDLMLDTIVEGLALEPPALRALAR